MNPFSQPKNYDEMLYKIMAHTFVSSLVCVALVSHYWPWLWNFLHPNWLTFDIEALGLHKIPPAYIVGALLVSWITRVSKLHDRISDLFGIRERFDLHEILIPMANGVGVAVDLDKQVKILKVRDDLMRRVFYSYANSTNPAIDGHLIWTALDRWSWFWICLESTVVGFIAFLTLLTVGTYGVAAWLGLIVIVFILVSTQVNRACASAAHAEIRAILDDPARITRIAAIFRRYEYGKSRARDGGYSCSTLGVYVHDPASGSFGLTRRVFTPPERQIMNS